MGRFSREANAPPPAVHALWLGATVASVVAIYQGGIDLTFLSTPFWANERRAAANAARRQRLRHAGGAGRAGGLLVPAPPSSSGAHRVGGERHRAVDVRVAHGPGRGGGRHARPGGGP
jgi:hypothetical protein